MNKKILKKILIISLFFLIPCTVFGQNSELENEEPNFEIPNETEEQNLENSAETDEFFEEFPEEIKNLKKNITIAHTQYLQTLNPHLSSFSSEAQILINVYEGLFSYNSKTLEPEYAIAKEYKISRDKKRWTFILKDEAKFSDGNKITAEDVKFSWITLLQTKDAPYSSLFDIIKGAKDFRNGKISEDEVGIYVLDEKTLSIHLNNPASYLPRLLCMPTFSVISKNSGVFSGPFCITMITPTEIQLTKNLQYYNSKNILLETADFLLLDDAEENTYLFNTGICDWITGTSNLAKIINQNSKQISAQFGTEFYFFKNYNETDSAKTEDFNIWNKKEFRQALLEACPWDKIRENCFVKATTLVYPVQNYPEVQGYNYTDPIEAKNIMNSARKKYQIPDDKILSVKIAISEYSLERTQLLEEAWKDLGVKVEYTVIKSGEFLQKMNQTVADMYLYSWVGDFLDPLSFLELFKSESALNSSKYKNIEFDKKLEEANLYTNENRQNFLAEAEQILLDDAIILPVQHQVSLNIINLQNIFGWYPNAFDLHPLKDIYIEIQKKTYPGLVYSE